MKQFLLPFIEQSLEALRARGHAIPSDVAVSLEVPRQADHGDLSTNVAMMLAKALKSNPRQIASELVQELQSRLDPALVPRVEIAGAGFINVGFSDAFYASQLASMLVSGEYTGENFGRNNRGRLVGAAGATGSAARANVEYVSANPTGLLHVGHGRNAAVGDTIANILAWNGYDVTREYYFNNAGNQMNNLGKSVHKRYLEVLDPQAHPFPSDDESLYRGEYIREIAAELASQHGSELVEPSSDNLMRCRKAGEHWCFASIGETMKRLNIKHDTHFNEDSLYTDGKVEETIGELRSRGKVYEKDGATWLALSQMGLSDDRVIVKSSGEPTYRLPDIAYHYDKLHNRKFDLVVDIFGADHIATIPDVLAAVETLGEDKNKVRVVIHQFVTLTKDGEAVKMSKRTGRSYTLDDLIAEFGPDVTRFFFIMRGVGTHLDFDLGLAAEQSEKNPVFYLQYAHARICSILRTAEERGVTLEASADANANAGADAAQDLTLLTHPSELDLIKILLRFAEVVERAGESLEPQSIAEYLREAAAAFHKFYHDCRILGEEERLMRARFALAKAAQIVLFNGLTILGVSTPEKM
jgi:arginyl-tRNA synthetase